MLVSEKFQFTDLDGCNTVYTYVVLKGQRFNESKTYLKKHTSETTKRGKTQSLGSIRFLSFPYYHNPIDTIGSKRRPGQTDVTE